MTRALKRGDEVVTVGGIVGEIVHITQGTKDGQAVVAMDDRVTIKSGDTRLVATVPPKTSIRSWTTNSGPAGGRVPESLVVQPAK